MKPISVFGLIVLMLFCFGCMDANPNPNQDELEGDFGLTSGDNIFYEDFTSDSEMLLTDENIIAQLQARQVGNIHSNALARSLDEDKVYDFYNTTFIDMPELDIKVLKSPEVGDAYNSILYSYVKDDIVLEQGVVLDYGESDTTYYCYFHDGTPLYSMQLFDNGIIVLYPPPEGSSNEVLSWWSDFTDCYDTELTTGIQVIIGASGSAAGIAAGLGASATTAGALGAAGIGAWLGVSVGCAAAVSVIMYGT